MNWEESSALTPADFYDRLTPRARQAFATARQEARLNDDFIGTLHLLLGILELKQGVAVNVLQKNGLTSEMLRAEIKKLTGPFPKANNRADFFTPRAAKALLFAAEEAKAVNHTYIGTEHLVLGLLRDHEDSVAHLFKQLGIDIKQTREEILKELNPGFPPQTIAQDEPVSSGLSWISTEWLSDFTPRANQVLALARKESGRFNHNYVGTEHLLLGLVRLGQGNAVDLLKRHGLELENARLEVEKLVGPPVAQEIIGNIPFTPRVKKVLALAKKEADSLKHTFIGTEHILLGLLGEGGGLAARILEAFNLDLEHTREEVVKAVNPDSSPGDAANGPKAG